MEASGILGTLTGKAWKKKDVKISNGMDVAKEYRNNRIMAMGDAKCGKTHFTLSVIEYLETDLKLKPEDIFFAFIDCDAGVQPLLEKGVVNSEYLKCIKYAFVNDMDETVSATVEFINQIWKWKETHPAEGAWIIIDNVQKVWKWTRDKFSNEVYGMPEWEKIKEARIESERQGGKYVPTFNQRSDYAVMNPIHEGWIDALLRCNINFIITCPVYIKTKEMPNGDTIIQSIDAKGHGDNDQKVDNILYFYQSDNKFKCDMRGSRIVTSYFRNLENPSFSRVSKAIQKLRPRQATMKPFISTQPIEDVPISDSPHENDLKL